ncbi:hypothetical protein ANHS_296 [Ligilactobacillus ruminis ATCC 25644]|nr:hypothetical protein ANHS_296 [Ligilactobacillus ruminis ATCC 25644]
MRPFNYVFFVISALKTPRLNFSHQKRIFPVFWKNPFNFQAVYDVF